MFYRLKNMEGESGVGRGGANFDVQMRPSQGVLGTVFCLFFFFFFFFFLRSVRTGIFFREGVACLEFGEGDVIM